MTEKISKPVAVCTVCGAYSRNGTSINERCGNRYSGKRCNGVWGSALNVVDWEECPSCNAAGKEAGARCTQCDGFGWIYCRK